MKHHSKEEARKNATYYGDDMRFMIYEGSDDYIFPATETMNTFHDIFDALGVRDTIKIEKVVQGMGHIFNQEEFDTMMSFIRGKDTGELTPEEAEEEAARLAAFEAQKHDF